MGLLSLSSKIFAATGTNAQISFQGKVTNADGTNVSNNNYSFTFNLYTVSSGGTAMWTETKTLAVSDGIFQTNLGSSTALPGSVDFNTDNLYLGVEFNGDGEMSPRVQFTVVPQAFNALKVAGLTVTNTTGTLTVPNGKTVAFADAFTTSGGFPLILTVGASTNVTLPASGMLSTLAGSETLTNKTLSSPTVSGTTGLTISGSTTDITTASGEGFVIQGNADSTIQTSSGTLTLQPAGTETSSVVQIGAGGAGSATPDLLALDVKSTTGDPASGVEGEMYYNTFDNKFRCYQNAAWTDCIGAGGSGSLTVRESDASPSISSISTLEFGPASSSSNEFVLTDQTGGVVRVVLGSTVVKTDAAQTLTNKTIGDGGLAVTNTTATTGVAITQTGASSALTITNAPGSAQSTDTVSITTGANVSGSSIAVNSAGTGNLVTLQKNGTDRFVVANSGGVTVTGSTANIVKTTSGTTHDTDFSKTGSTLTNVSSTNDTITIDDGTIPSSGQGTMATSTVTTSANVGAGGFSILRDDGKYVVVHGGSLATGSLWDGSTGGAMGGTATNVVSTGSVGAGAIAIRRPDKRYLIVHGGGVTNSSLFDPAGVTAVAAGPTLTSCTATTGTNAFVRDDGKYVILCGGSANWGVYDPTGNTYAAGTAVSAAFGAGAHAVHRDDGTFLVFRGGGTTDHWLYDPFAAATGTMTLNPITTNAPTISAGAFSIRRLDGKFLILGGAVNSSTIFDPTPVSGVNSGVGSMTAQSGAGYGPTSALADGSYALWRQDKTYLLMIGGSTTTNIVDMSTTDNQQFTSGPTLNGTAGAGGSAFFRPDGQYQMIRGGASTTTDTYDIGYIMGGNGSGTQLASYESECITSTSLNADSRAFWTANAEGTIDVQVRTGNGSCSGTYTDIARSGDTIAPVSGDNRVQMKVFFSRPFPAFADQDWGIRRSASQVVYRRLNADPSLYDVAIDNANLVHRTKFDFGQSSDSSGPVSLNLVSTANETLSLAASAGQLGYGTTINASNPVFYNGSFATHTPLVNVASAGGVLMRRPDKKYVYISGGTSANAQVYDADAETFTALGTTPSAGTGTGALAFKRPDGKFFIVLGGGTTTTTIFDPVANTFSSGAALTAAAGRGAQMIPLPNGRVLIIHGAGTTTTSIYDPINNTMVAGPLTSAGVGEGSLVIPRPNGTFLLVIGMTNWCVVTTTTNNFDPYTMVFTATGSPGITTGTGPGAHAFQRSDGQWVIVHGGGAAACAGTNRTQIYNPITNQSIVGPTLTAVAGRGAHSVPLPDGSWLTILGNASTTTNLYLEQTGAFTANGLGGIGARIAGPALITAASNGAMSFQRDDGKFVTIVGGGVATVHEYDAGWVATGTYKSEQMNVADLDVNSTLTWKATPDMRGISAEVSTATSQVGLQAASSREVTTSGGLINPGTSETWLQINFNFKRDFPSYGGIETDVWYNGGSGFYAPLRKIVTPTLTEFKVGKDINLVDLRADGLSVFRVSSSGDIFSSVKGSVNTGGADLAERYTSQVELEKGEVVSLDPLNNHGVKRSVYQYQPDVLGVVSTAPGFVAGSYTDDSYPIALVGRVPVKVSTENGSVHAGDRLTASSVPGHAMKATMAGRVLGVALENLDETTLTECPESSIVIAKRTCGEVMMFVNLVDYSGTPVELAMADVQHALPPGMAAESTPSVYVQELGTSADILSYLTSLKQAQDAQMTTQSEIVTNRLSAVNEIISPKLVTDILYAKTIKADSIEGLEIYTDNILSRAQHLADVIEQATSSATTTPASASADTALLSSLHLRDAVVELNLTVLGAVDAQSGLTVAGPVEFHSTSLFDGIATFLAETIFQSNVQMKGKLTVHSDTAGLAKITKNSKEVRVVFETPYSTTPVVTATQISDAPRDEHANSTATAEQQFFLIVDRSADGFTILLEHPAAQDALFSWVAVGVDKTVTTESQGTNPAESAAPSPLVTPSPTPSETPSPFPSPTPSPSPEPEVPETATESASP